MDFVVLARKLRPTRFADLIGQDTVVRALRNAILTDRVAHAFLFTGSRGVGKTSTARILTKALNCEQPADGEPCNACGNCTEISANASPDVYEIDAASNRGIDNIRELRENTKYAPVKSRFKTYIIDEVHMLTMESFNALLKTLEEPPPHVKFILATTNPHRIPDTILSRCQRYDFARIPVGLLTDYLVQVTGREGIKLSRTALETIARNAAGGVRDALTAVDQVVSFAGNEAADDQVLNILGLADHREIFALLGAVLDKDLPAALAAFGTVRARGHDLGVVLESLIREVKDFSLYLSLAGTEGGAEGQHAAAAAFADHPPETLAFYGERRGRVTLDELQQVFYLLLEVEDQLKRSDFAQACFEMGLVKACHVQPLVAVTDLLAQARALTQALGGEPGTPPRAAAPPQGSAPAPAQGPAAASQAARIAAQVQSRGREPGRTHGGSRSGAGRSPGDDGDEAEPAAAPTAAAPSSTAAAPAAPADDAPPPADGSPDLPEPPARPEPPDLPEPPARPEPPDLPEPPPELGRGPSAGSAPIPEEAATDASLPPWERRRRANGSAAGSAPEPPPEPEPAPPVNGAPAAPPERTQAAATDGEGAVPADEGPGLCDDPRWRAFVDALGEPFPRLASKLRGAEVTELDDARAVLVPADPANRPTDDELSNAGALLAEHFGAAFHIDLINDTTRKAREALTIAGRNRILAHRRLMERRAEAEGDTRVQQLLRIFPGGRVVDVALSPEPPLAGRGSSTAPELAGRGSSTEPPDAPHPKRSEDV